MTDRKEIEAKLQVVLDRQVELGNTAGLNLLILKDGEEAAYVQSGYADVDRKKPFDRDTIMRIYSMTKPITSAAVMILVDRGLISLGEQVWRYLPGFKDQKIWVNDKMTRKVNKQVCIRDLLFMTSGLPYGDPTGKGAFRKVADVYAKIDKKLYTKKQMTTVEIANELGAAGLDFEPGQKFLYGTSADILGAIVEVVTGMTYGEFLRKELFDPLEMEDTGFYVPAEKKDRLASAYERRDGKLVLFETNNLGIRYHMDPDPAFESGGAGLASTLDDYSHFASMLMNGGRYKDKQIISEDIVRLATHGRLTPAQEESFWQGWDTHSGYSYGWLMQHMIDPQKAYHLSWADEYGWDGWLGTYFCNSPHNRVTILIGEQISNPEGNLVYEKVKNVLCPLIDR